MNAHKGEMGQIDIYIKTSPNYVSRRTRFRLLLSPCLQSYPICLGQAYYFSQIYLLTQYTAPGLLFLFPATLPSKLYQIAPSQSQNYKNGPCTGPLLALLLPLSMSQSGSLAGRLGFLCIN